MVIGKNVRIWGEIEKFRNDIVTTGDNVVIASESVIITHCPISFYNGKKVDITIGNNVYIGRKSIILPSVTIGDNVVIGAGSVVSGDIPSNCTAGGNPCRKIRSMTEVEIKRLRLLTEQNKIADGSEPQGMENDEICYNNIDI